MSDSSAHTERNFIVSLRLLLPALVFYCSCLLMFAVFRALLCVVFYENIADVDNVLLVFPVGLRMDTVLLCYVLALPVVGMIFLPGKAVRKTRVFFSGYLACAAGIFIFLEMATFAYMDEFSVRPDRIFLQNMFSGLEVARMIAQGLPRDVCFGFGHNSPNRMAGIQQIIPRFCRTTRSFADKKNVHNHHCAPAFFSGYTLKYFPSPGQHKRCRIFNASSC